MSGRVILLNFLGAAVCLTGCADSPAPTPASTTINKTTHAKSGYAPADVTAFAAPVGSAPTLAWEKAGGVPGLQLARSPSLQLELSYIYEIIIPRGSELKVTIKDAVGKAVLDRKIKIAREFPPYFLEVPIDESLAYPLTVHANLRSSLGHEFSQTAQVDQSQVKKAEPVPIEMK
jgi:hypothetical protein